MPITKEMPLSELWDLLNKHDWLYNYTDDHAVWKKGQAAHVELIRLCERDQERHDMYIAFKRHYEAKPGDVQPPKPKRPE